MKKLLTYSVVIATIVWSLGLAAVVPLATAAYSPSEGDLVKTATDSAVYYIDSEGMRHLMVNAVTYWTWYSGDWADQDIETISQDDFDALDAGSNITARPGVNLIKFQNSPKTYAVLPGNVLAHLEDEDAAIALYGDDWQDRVITIQNGFENNYSKTGGTLTADSNLPDGSLIKYEGSDDVYYIEDGMKRMVTDEGFVANSFKDTAVVTVPTSMTYDSGESITGEEAAIAKPMFDEEGGDMSSGTLSVTLASDTPAATTIADGIAYQPMLKVNLSASGEAIDVEGVTIKRTGLIANSNVTGVSVWDADGNRHGDVMTSFNSNNEVTIGFGSYPIPVDANSTETLLVAFNIGADANGGTVGASIVDVDSNASDTMASYPIAGNTFSVQDGSSSLSTATVAAQAVGGNNASTDSANVEIGDEKEIYKFKITESSGKNDIQLDKVTFFFEGTAKDGDVGMLSLYAPDNTLLGSTDYIYDRYATIVLDTPYTIGSSNNRTLTLKGVIEDGSGNYFRVNIQSEYDIMIKDKDQGYYLTPTDTDGGSWSAETSTNGYWKMKSGTLNLSKASASLSGNVAAGADDLVIGKFDVKAVGEDMEIRKIGLKIATTAGTTDLAGNLIVKIDGETVLTTSATYDSGATPGATAGAVYGLGEQFTLSSYYTIESGETALVEVIADIDANANGDTYQASIGNFYAKRKSTLDFADNLPSTSYTGASGNVLTVETVNLTVVKDTAFPNSTVAKGSSQKIGQFIVAAGNAEPVTVSNLTVDIEGNFSGNGSDIQNMELWDGGKNTQFGDTISTVATSSNSFSVNIELDKNESTKVEVWAYVLAGADDKTGCNVEMQGWTYSGDESGNSTSVSNDPQNGQTIAIGSANVVISAANDTTTQSEIKLAGSDLEQVGKWKVEATGDDVTFSRLSFFSRTETGANDTTASNFGGFELFDADDMSNPIDDATYIAGRLTFDGFDWTVDANDTKYLVLKAVINDQIDVASKNAFVVLSDSSTYLQAKDSSGNSLSTSQIDATAGDNTTNEYFATSTMSLYHNAAPTVAEVSLGTTYQISATANIFKFTVTNNGNRSMRLSSVTTTITGTGFGTDGYVYNFKLWEGGTLLAEFADNADVGRVSSTRATVDAVFNSTNDVGSVLDNFEIEPGESRTLTVSANTLYAGVGASQKTVTLSGAINGTTQFNALDTGGADGDTSWGTTNTADAIGYHYTPIDSTENTVPYTASDSYDVFGSALSKSY